MAVQPGGNKAGEICDHQLLDKIKWKLFFFTAISMKRLHQSQESSPAAPCTFHDLPSFHPWLLQIVVHRVQHETSPTCNKKIQELRRCSKMATARNEKPQMRRLDSSVTDSSTLCSTGVGWQRMLCGRLSVLLKMFCLPHRQVTNLQLYFLWIFDLSWINRSMDGTPARLPSFTWRSNTTSGCLADISS